MLDLSEDEQAKIQQATKIHSTDPGTFGWRKRSTTSKRINKVEQHGKENKYAKYQQVWQYENIRHISGADEALDWAEYQVKDRNRKLKNAVEVTIKVIGKLFEPGLSTHLAIPSGGVQKSTFCTPPKQRMVTLSPLRWHCQYLAGG
jgi:hypothetical protein